MALGFGGASEPNLRFCELFVLPSPNFEFTKTPRELFLVAYD